MSRSLNAVVAAAVFASTATVGVVTARALGDGSSDAEPSMTAIIDDSGAAVEVSAKPAGTTTVADLSAPAARLIPVVEPVAVGFDDSIGTELLAVESPSAPGIAGSSAGFLPPVYAGAVPADTAPTLVIAAEPATTDGAAPSPTLEPDTSEPIGAPAPAAPTLRLLDLLGGFSELLGPIRFDPCAGIEPATPVPEGCPEGYAATFGGTFRLPPPAFMFLARGHYLTRTVPDGLACPADTPTAGPGEGSMTLFTRTPLTDVEVRYRPYGSSDSWTTLTIPGSSAEQTAWWNERFDTIDYDIDWATVPICFSVPRDPAFAYEIDATATDAFGRTVHANSTGIIPLDAPDRRPPTTGQVLGLSSVAVVEARATEAGVVQFRSRPVRGDDDDLQCTGAELVESGVSTFRGRIVSPAGVYDPAYTQLVSARIPIPPGSQVVVCADIYDTTNTLRSPATDRLLFSAPTQERPRIVLQGIRRLGSATIGPGLSVAAGFELDPCADWYVTRDPLEAGRSHTIEHVLWECSDDPLPVGGDGSVDVPITLTRTVPRGSASPERRQEQIAVPIRLQACADPGGCSRPREWYEIPIPWGGSRLCGTSFGSGGCGDPDPPDGIAVIRVEYPVVAGPVDAPPAGGGTVTLLDQVDAAAPAGAPRITLEPTFEWPVDGDALARTARIRIQADRPVQITIDTIETFASCAVTAPVTSTGFSDEFEVEIPGLCAGASYQFPYRVVDEAGNEYVTDFTYMYTPPAISTTVSAQVDFLGGPDVAEFGYIYRFGVSLDGQNPTAYWWDWTGRRGSVDGCRALTGTTARSRGGAPQRIYLGPSDLDVEIRVNITTTGSGDCSGRSATGLGEIVVTGRFTRDQVLSNEPLVLETEPGTALPMRLTVTPISDWR